MTSGSDTITESSALALNENETRILVKIDGLWMSVVEKCSETDADQVEESICHLLSWLPDTNMLNHYGIIALCNRVTNIPKHDESSKIPISKDLKITALIFISETLKTTIKSYPRPYLKRSALWAERHLNKLPLE